MKRCERGEKLKMDYCPHTPDDITQMQAAIGVAGLDELFAEFHKNSD